MRFDPTIRYLARSFLEGPPQLGGARALARLAEAVRVDDLTVQPISQVSVSTATVAQRVQLTSEDSQWQLTLMGESIDLAHLPRPDTEPIPFADYLTRARDVFAAVADLTSRQPHRLACVREGLLPEMSEEKKNDVARRLLNYPETFDPAPWEWDWRCAATVVRQFGACSEDTNTIVTAKRIAGTFAHTGSAFDRIRVDLDINTSPKKDEPRFDRDSIVAFFDESMGWHAQLSEETARFLGVEE